MTKYIEDINVENCNKLLAWLEAGAPHAVFHMRFSNGPIENVCSIEDLRTYYPSAYQQVEAKGIGACGTVCCIAGAAAGMASGDIAKPLDEGWHDVTDKALKFLGIKRQSNPVDSWMIHDLFDPFLAPENCTPQQAAQALRNVMEGKDPWEGVA